jgi:hypothetical protein
MADSVRLMSMQAIGTAAASRRCSQPTKKPTNRGVRQPDPRMEREGGGGVGTSREPSALERAQADAQLTCTRLTRGHEVAQLSATRDLPRTARPIESCTPLTRAQRQGDRASGWGRSMSRQSRSASQQRSPVPLYGASSLAYGFERRGSLPHQEISMLQAAKRLSTFRTDE